MITPRDPALICDCGHALRDHMPKREHHSGICLVAGCSCVGFHIITTEATHISPSMLTLCRNALNHIGSTIPADIVLQRLLKICDK